MEKIKFSSNQEPTVGVEIELALVHSGTGALTNGILGILDRVPPRYREKVKPELMQCYLEINSDTCRSIDEVHRDLREKILAVQKIAESTETELYWAGTHPFSSWKEQKPFPSERYAMLLHLLQELGRQLVTFGLHVHVGLESGDKAIMVCNRLLKHLPVLLALSANSPWWDGRTTGMLSHRIKIMEMLPTAGLPPLMSNWSEYIWLVNHLIETGFINTIREIWWDVRPHHNFGTVEIRICDTPGCLKDAMAIAALVQCLVVHLSHEIDFGAYQHDGHPMIIRQNKWQATRYGLDAKIVDGISLEYKSARERLEDLHHLLEPTARQLDCLHWLERVREMARKDNWAQRQLAERTRLGSYPGTIRSMLEQSRLRSRIA